MFTDEMYETNFYGSINYTKLIPLYHIIDDKINYIPNYVTHLYINFREKKLTNKTISSHITHLMFNNSFNQDIKDCIPNSVTHLT